LTGRIKSVDLIPSAVQPSIKSITEARANYVSTSQFNPE